MKFLISATTAVILTLVVFAAGAQTPQIGGPPPADAGQNFEAHKKEMLEKLDKAIAAMGEARNCMAAAADREALRKCHMAARHDRMEMREQHMDKRMERMERRKHRLEKKSGEAGSGD